MVVVHAEEGAGTGAAGAGAETNNIHAFVHPSETRDAAWCLYGRTGRAREAKGSRRRRRSKRSGRQRREKEEGEEGKSSHLPNTLTGGGEEGGGEGGRGEKRDMTGPCDLSALWKGAQGGVCECAFSKMSF